EHRDEPTDVAEIVGQRMTCRNGELHSTLARNRRLAEEQGGDDGVADVPDDGRREGLLHERRTVDELDRLVEPPELDQAADHVQPVRELVLLRTQRVREAAHVRELAEQRLELRAVAERPNRS